MLGNSLFFFDIDKTQILLLTDNVFSLVLQPVWSFPDQLHSNFSNKNALRKIDLSW